MKAKSIKGKSVVEIKTALESSIEDGFKPTLAIVFISIVQNREAICDLLDSSGISIFGATTHGEFISKEIEEKSIVVMLLDINREYFKILYDEFKDGNYRETSKKMAQNSLEIYDNSAFLISVSNMITDVEKLILGFEEILGKDVNIFGGGAGDDFAFKEQFVFTNGKSSNNGIVALLLDKEKILIKGIATHGWMAVGTEKTVTRSEGNHVYTVDNVPVLELTKKYGGLDELTPEGVENLGDITATLPLQLQRETGAAVMRPGLIVDWEDGSFYCGGTVPQGSKVRFSIPPDFSVIEKVVDEVKKMKEREIPFADAIVVFSCAGRIHTLGPLMKKEVEGVQNVWDAPLVGFFSSGEIARATDGNNDLHNLTTCTVAIKEKI